MKNQIKRGSLLYLLLLAALCRGLGQPAIPLTIEADHPLARIQPTMWGLFLEDINFAADGGMYAAANVRMASPENRSVWETALPEAAFMKGLERNADAVCMVSCAPLLAHTEAWYGPANDVIINIELQ
jgi:hypothetical protein